jgi:hypothetical protein
MLAVTVFLRLKHYRPLSQSLLRGADFFPGYRLLDFVDWSLGKGYYWQAEKVLEVYFQEVYERGELDVPYRGMEEVAVLVHHFARQYEQDVEKDVEKDVERDVEENDKQADKENKEQELWARIAILQTFCEGVLNRCSLLDEVPEETSWSLPNLTSTLGRLMARAISRDESGEWQRSRAFIRQQLIELDRDVIANERHSKRHETLLKLSELAEANNDKVMKLLIDDRSRLLGQGQGQGVQVTMGLFSVPFRVYKALENTERIFDHGVVYFPRFGPEPPMNTRKEEELATSKNPLRTPLGGNEKRGPASADRGRSGERDTQDSERDEKKALRSRSRHESNEDRHKEERKHGNLGAKEKWRDGEEEEDGHMLYGQRNPAGDTF